MIKNNYDQKKEDRRKKHRMKEGKKEIDIYDKNGSK